MKRLFFVIAMVLALGFALIAHAAPLPLQNNGNNLIYDPNLNVTWYAYIYSPPVIPSEFGTPSWDQAVTWASSLTVGGVTGWTLPTTPGTTTTGTPGAYTDQGEMGYLYYDELRNPAGGPPTNLSFLAGAQAPGSFWLDNSPTPGRAWMFITSDGEQWLGYSADGIGIDAIAVHSGDVGAPIPIPGAILLFASGLVGLAAMRRKVKK